MDLYLTHTSPYARKLRVQVALCGLENEVREILCNPHDDPPELLAVSPVGKVPVLVDEGQVISDSRVIAEYLDAYAPGGSLYREGESIWGDRTRTAIADGVIDAAVSLVIESRRAESERSPSFVARQRERILRTVETLTPGGPPLSIGDIATGVALSYLDFRLPDLDWRTVASSDLVAWHREIASTPAFRGTEPPK